MRKRRSYRKKLASYSSYIIIISAISSLLLLRSIRHFLIDNVKHFFSEPYLYDRYDRKWTFKNTPNTALLLIETKPETFLESGDMQNIVWAYIWSIFIKKYTQLTPTIVLNIPKNTKISDLDLIKDNINVLHEQLAYSYKDPFMDNNRVDFIFEDSGRFRKSQNINTGMKVLIVDKNSQKYTVDVDGILELHGPLTMSIIGDYTPVMKEIFNELIKDYNSEGVG